MEWHLSSQEIKPKNIKVGSSKCILFRAKSLKCATSVFCGAKPCVKDYCFADQQQRTLDMKTVLKP